MQSINKSQFLTINNIPLFVMIRGKNLDNPILLILHGGSSQSANFSYFNKDLEKEFTVVYFDQRGEARSNLKEINPNTLTLENYIEDTHHLTTYLKNRFNKEKIYLLGHSMGTLLGINTIKKYPKDYIAYIGVSQNTDPIESEKIAYDMLENDEKVNKKQLHKIPRITYENIDTFNIKRRTKEVLALSMKYGGMLYKTNIFTIFKILILPILLFKPYTFKNKKDALTQHKERLLFFYKNPPMQSIKKLDIPVYFIHGKDDLIINHKLTKEYFNTLQAPYKEFITFEKSAHFPQFEEAEKFNKLLCKLLKNKNLD